MGVADHPDCVHSLILWLLVTYQIVLLWWRKLIEWALVSQPAEQQAPWCSLLDHTHSPPREHRGMSWVSWASLRWWFSHGGAGGRGQGARPGRMGGVLAGLRRSWCHRWWRILCLCSPGQCAVHSRLEQKPILTYNLILEIITDGQIN